MLLTIECLIFNLPIIWLIFIVRLKLILTQMSISSIRFHLNIIPYGLVVRILAFHAGGPGSIPGVGKYFYFENKKFLLKKNSSLGGFEPPTFRLTAERASRLRHRDY